MCKKQVTIDELEQLLGEPDKHVDIKPNGEIFVIDYKEKIKQLEAELEKHCWIPVEERLPGRGDRVLIIDNDGNPLSLWLIGKTYAQCAEWQSKGITHWKPITLPEGGAK